MTCFRLGGCTEKAVWVPSGSFRGWGLQDRPLIRRPPTGHLAARRGAKKVLEGGPWLRLLFNLPWGTRPKAVLATSGPQVTDALPGCFHP